MFRILFLLFLCVSQALFSQDLKPYKKYSKSISGTLSSIGSDTLANLMSLWAEKFRKVYPNVQIQIQAAGSSTAPPALTNSTSNLGPMSRKMKSKEIEAFEKKYKYKPTAIPVAIDALAVYVNKDNPIKELSLKQVDAIFSMNRRCGHPKSIDKWSDLKLKGSLGKKKIQLYGRNSVSGTYGYFKKVALCKGDFKNSVNEQPGSSAVVQSISNSINSIGYSGIGYRTSSVRVVPIVKNGVAYEASEKNTASMKYPLARYLYIYVNKTPNKPLANLEREFFRMILSKDGQEVVKKEGYMPLNGKTVQKLSKKFDL